MSTGCASVVAAQGPACTVEWAKDGRDRMPAREFFETLGSEDQAKILALFNRLAQTGRISNYENFHLLGTRAAGKARSLWEFKKFQLRFIGAYRPGHRFVVAHGLRKKGDDLKQSDIEKALRIMQEHDELVRKGETKP